MLTTHSASTLKTFLLLRTLEAIHEAYIQKKLLGVPGSSGYAFANTTLSSYVQKKWN
jgi:hypothetical protein